jgi:hypothetical protein
LQNKTCFATIVALLSGWALGVTEGEWTSIGTRCVLMSPGCVTNTVSLLNTKAEILRFSQLIHIHQKCQCVHMRINRNF